MRPVLPAIALLTALAASPGCLSVAVAERAQPTRAFDLSRDDRIVAARLVSGGPRLLVSGRHGTLELCPQYPGGNCRPGANKTNLERILPDGIAAAIGETRTIVELTDHFNKAVRIQTLRTRTQQLPQKITRAWIDPVTHTLIADFSGTKVCFEKLRERGNLISLADAPGECLLGAQARVLRIVHSGEGALLSVEEPTRTGTNLHSLSYFRLPKGSTKNIALRGPYLRHQDGGAATYLLLPLAIVGDILTSPFQLLYYISSGGKCMPLG